MSPANLGLLAIALCLPAVAHSQQPLRPPQIVPFGDAEWWVLAAPLPTRIGQSSEVITVPRGFVSDLTSIPRFFWSAFPKTGQYMSAAILHDYLYWDQRCTRQQADQIFDIEMRSFGVSSTSRALIFSAVSEFGGGAWQANASAKAVNTLRFLPDAQLDQFLSEPLDATKTWVSVRSQLTGSRAPLVQSVDLNPDLSAVCTRAVQGN